MTTEKSKTAPTPVASKKIAELYLMLDDRYDRDAKRYREGWTDEKIADELGVAVGLVAARREQDFGPIVEPPKVISPAQEAQIRAALTATLQEIRVLQDQAERLRLLVVDLANATLS